MRMIQLVLFVVLYPAVRLFGFGLAAARMVRSRLREGAWPRPEPGPRSRSPFVSQIEAVLQHTGPAAFCLPCLATRLALPEKQLRVATRFLRLHPDIRVHVGACHICQRWERVIRMVAPRA
jgi:hypothetical protein